MDFCLAQDIQKRLTRLVKKLELNHINSSYLYGFRSYGSRSRARARIWSLPSIWQKALDLQPGYCIEVLSENFDKLSADDQTRTLIHELLHIPKTFSGALLPHRGRGRVRVDQYAVDKMFRKLEMRGL